MEKYKERHLHRTRTKKATIVLSRAWYLKRHFNTGAKTEKYKVFLYSETLDMNSYSLVGRRLVKLARSPEFYIHCPTEVGMVALPCHVTIKENKTNNKYKMTDVSSNASKPNKQIT